MKRLLAVFLLSACGASQAGTATIVLPRAISAASGAPEVSRVKDLGEPVALPDQGPLSLARSDGALTIGEYVLIEGDDFGKLPTVLIGGRPGRVIARTAGGGIVSQIPTGVPGGTTFVEVSHPGGKHQSQITITRHAVIARPGNAAHVIALGADSAGEPLAVEAAGPIGISPDGAWAYVAATSAGQPALVTVALAAPGGPTVVRTTRGQVAARQVALGGKRLVVLGKDSFQLFELDAPGAPADYDAMALPADAVKAEVVAAALSPDGEIIAVLSADNHVRLWSLARPEAPTALADMNLLPGQRLPLARALRFDGGGTLWVVSGDTPTSAGVGHQPSRLSRVDVAGGKAVATVEIAGAGPPVAFSPSPRESLKSATTIGDTDDDLPLFVTTLAQSLVPLDGKAVGEVLTAAAQLAEPGQLVRTDRAGRGGPLPGLPGSLLGGVAVSPDATLVLATGLRTEGGKSGFGVWLVPLASGEPRFVSLGGVGDGGFSLPSSLGEVAVQP